MADEQEAESWEELEDSGELDKRIQQITILKREPQNKSSATTRPGGGVIPQEDNQRTAYQPSVKILKRQANSGDAAVGGAGGAGKAQQQQKTLEQREAEYAEARMRIFGAATSNPSEQEEPAVSPRPERLLQRVEEMRVSDNVIRQPRGPDPTGDKGFSPATR